MSKRIRVVQYVVQPVVVVDDGENLTPLEVQPIPVPAARWAEFVQGGLDQALTALQAQIEQPADDATATLDG